MKILLILMRKDKSVLAEERREFITLGELDPEQTDVLDVYAEPDFDPTIAQNYDAVFIGGLSDDDPKVLDFPESDFPFIRNLEKLIALVIHAKIPLFASCGGFQVLALHLGARMVIDPDMAEVGSAKIILSKQGIEDTLFAGYPESFSAVVGHNKSIVDFPDSCQVLASSKDCPVHVFTVVGKPCYAFQFHPEITPQDFQKRADPFWQKYFPNRKAYDRTLHELSESKYANTLIKAFVDRIVIPQISNRL